MSENFRFETRRNVFPHEVTVDNGFVRATDPMTALKDVVRSYARPSSVVSVELRTQTQEDPVLARYLSTKAVSERYELVA